MTPVSLAKGTLQNLVVGSGKDVSWLRTCSWVSTPSFSNLEGGLLQLVSKLWTYSYFSPPQKVSFVVVSTHPAVIRKKCGKEKKKTPHTLLSDFRYTISFHRQPCLCTSNQLHRTVSKRRHSTSAKNFISQLSLPEQLVLFPFHFFMKLILAH